MTDLLPSWFELSLVENITRFSTYKLSVRIYVVTFSRKQTTIQQATYSK